MDWQTPLLRYTEIPNSMEENSISIINRTNGQLTGENAKALPIQLMGSWKWPRYVALGFALAILIGFWFVTTIKKQVVAVEVSGKSDSFQILKIQ